MNVGITKTEYNGEIGYPLISLQLFYGNVFDLIIFYLKI